MIAELLGTGEESAITGQELAKALNCDIRTITAQIELERRNGQPICATPKGSFKGYFLAANQQELETYCKRLHHRAAELYKTRQVLLSVLKQLPGVKQEG